MSRPSELIAAIYDRIEAADLAPVWISLVPREASLQRARELENGPRDLPLYGLPFAVKDNIDLVGLPTTAGCPAYAYAPERSSFVVTRLLAAGAIPIGKTNLDQFATGLVGTRSPHGASASVFDSRYISGGSSSGSAVAVASGLCDFALGTDTAGSGRVPAAFNGLIGLKPTRGSLSTSGVVPACRSLDCVSIFARTCHEAQNVLRAAREFDRQDPFSREPRAGEGATPWCSGASGLPCGAFRFGVPPASQLEFFGDEEAAALFRDAVAAIERLGGTRVEIDFSLFRAAADLLYSGPWVAERLAAIGPFLEMHGDQMNSVVRGIIAGARKYSAVDAYNAEYKLREIRRACESEWSRMDVLVTPTTGTIYTHEQIAADPIQLNTNLGYYTNFVNLLDLAAVALPAGFRSNGLPFGISIAGPAFSDDALLWLADRCHRSCTQVPGPAIADPSAPPGCVTVAVVGAHLSGQPLNHQLTSRGARLMRTCRTAPDYRLYALAGTQLFKPGPAKPGLARDPDFVGPGIEVEVWAIPEDRFGGFVAEVPPPLGIGSATLDDGTSVKCFIVEPHAVRSAAEITHFGGWRNYLAARPV